MAEIPVEQTAVATAEPSPALPLWAALLGLAAIAATVWVLFQMGASVPGPAPAASADAYAVAAPGADRIVLSL